MSRPARHTATDGYRTDIDGLRAVAVTAVVLFHFNIAGWHLPAGFFGVDVFFVISGFLITRMISEDLENHRFQLRRFYQSRFQRLGPALLSLIGATLGAGYLLLLPSDYGDLAASAHYALFALSNFYFYGETGYFDQAAHLQPLLHTWSLAIEEQFYLVWPLLLLLLHRLGGRRWILAGTALITAASFVYCVRLVQWEQSAAFYSPLARAWELAIGGLLSFAPPMTRRYHLPQWCGAGGFVLLAYALAGAGHSPSVPGVGTLPAIAAALLLLYPKPRQPLVGQVLSIAPLRYLGRISYSLYLWHWPVLVLGLHYNAARELSAAASLTLLAIALGLAVAAYHGVETPLRYRRFVGRHGLLAALGALCVVSLGATLVLQSGGLPQRIYADGRPVLDRRQLWAWEPATASDTGWAVHPAFGAPWPLAAERIVLWGDSHAAHLAPLLEQAIAEQQRPTAVVLASGCPPTIDGSRYVSANRGQLYNNDCAFERNSLFRFLRTSKYPVDRVVITAAWANQWRHHTRDENQAQGYSLQQQALTETISELQAAGVNVAIVGQMPQWQRDPILCVASQLPGLWRKDCKPELTQSTMPAHFDPVHALLRSLETETIQVLLPHQQLCEQNRCLTELAGEFLYRDEGHLRRNLTAPTRGELARRAGLDQLL